MRISATSQCVLFSDVKASEDTDNELYMPLSTMTVGTSLVDQSITTKLIDAQVDKDWRRHLAEQLKTAFIFGVSSLTGPSIWAVLEAIRICRETRPDISIVWGGYHATLVFDAILKEGLVDYVVRGAGEHAMLQLCQWLIETKGEARPHLSIPGVAFIDNDCLVAPEPARLLDINSLPPLNYDLIDVPQYFGQDRKSIEYISSYGCPHECTFCVEPGHTGRKWRGLDPARVVNEVSHLFFKYQPDLIGFQDPSFCSSPKRVAGIVEEMESRGLSIPMSVDLRARDIVRLSRLIDLRRFRAVGFKHTFLGIESGSNRVLEQLKKQMTAAEAYEAARGLSDAGVTVAMSFIHDLPNESEEDSEQTFALIWKLCQLKNVRQLHHFYMPYPFTELSLSNIDRDRQRSQEEWARTSTYSFETESQARQQFRRKVVKRLMELQKEYPEAIHPSKIPTYGLNEAKDTRTACQPFWQWFEGAPYQASNVA